MNEWQKIQLDALVDIGSSKRIYYKEYVQIGIPFYRSKEIIEKHNGQAISTELQISIDKYNDIKAKFGVPEEGDMLLTSVGTLGIPYIVQKDEKFYFKDGNLTWFRNFNNSLLNKFLYYWIISSIGKNELDMVSIGSTQPALTIRGLKGITIDLPPLPEQKAIALVLSSFDDKISLLHSQNKTLEQLAETLFRQWFVEEADDGWENVCLNDIADINPTYQLKKGELSSYLEMKNVSTTTFNPEGWYNREFTSGMKFKNGDTILARITPCLENGKTCFVMFLDEEEIGWGSTEYIVIRMKEPFHPYISYIIAKNLEFRDFAISSMSGSSGRQRAQGNVIKEYEINVPPLEVIEELNNQLTGIIPKLKNNANQIRTLVKLRDTLLPKLMSGEVRVEFNNS